MRKQWKKISLMMTALTIAGMMITGCGKNNETSGFRLEQGQSDLEYVQSKGTLVVGITDYAPMDYKNGEQWTGFDASLAEAFAESIGVTVEWMEIDWDQKTKLLENGNIDCIWNGMTMTEELQETIDCSNPYLSNAQVVVLRSSEMEKYDTIENCQHLLFAVESGSTGESLIKKLKYRYNTFSTQMEALQSVSKKKTDATVIDIIMAAYYTGEGKEFSTLEFNISLNDEKICVGFRKDSDLTEKANEFIKNEYENGTINFLAEQYGIESAVLE